MAKGCKLIFKYATGSGKSYKERTISAAEFEKKVKAARKLNPKIPTVEKFKQTACRQRFLAWGVCKPVWWRKHCPDKSPTLMAMTPDQVGE